MRISLLTLGCRVNQAETFEMERSFSGKGHLIVALDEAPELCIINTCTVTAKSDYQSRQLIRRAHRAGARVIVTGCYAELNAQRAAQMEGVEAVVSNENKTNIISMVKPEGESYALNNSPGRSRYTLKVQDGCNSACAYCVIPRARGRARSLEPERVIDGVKKAVSAGYKEVVLSGINLGHYGLDTGSSLTALIREIINRTSLERLRLSSIEITEINDDLLGLFESKRLCRHLHIPLQSGDDRTLRLMNRKYDSRYFSSIIKKISGMYGDIAIGTDVIAGFPGEDEKKFKNTLNLIAGLPFTYIHAFPYSRRPATAAALMPESVNAAEKKERVRVLRGLSLEKRDNFIEKLTANREILEVLIEQDSGGMLTGTSGNYLKVRVPKRENKLRSIVSVRLSGLNGGRLYGKPIV